MSRVDLIVPYAPKELAKARGARWDPAARVWYVSADVDIVPFANWLPVVTDDEGPDIRAKRYYIAESERQCWKCRKRAPVFAFILPLGHEVAWDDDGPLGGRWVPMHDIESTLSGVDKLCGAAAEAMREVTGTYRPSSRHGGLWVNHCLHCNAVFGDFYDHCEPEGAFCPMTGVAASRIQLIERDEFFNARAGHGNCLFFDSMTVLLR
jgi:hypothetical protein